MRDHRKNPEQILYRIQQEEQKQNQGRLKIYLGAAPGVGKTYEMLHDALEKRAQGLDVIIGVVESHGRKDIEAMIAQLDMLPRQQINYHGRVLTEFDLDAAIKRAPGLILIDEMAHTNIPGLRHEKRWQDIKELLSRGIDVDTTLNVQHIESLNDDITQIIQAPIKETVPDSMIEMADTLELIDLPPEDLLQRLKEGKIYIPAQANFAKEHFFRRGNLIALRELALRATAARVGAEVLMYRQGEGIQKIWPTREKILVCVGSNVDSLKLIRAAKQMALNLHAEWIAIYVQQPQRRINEKTRNRIIQNLRFAELLGAETHFMTGIDIVKEVIHFAREKNVTQIMIRKHIRTFWHAMFRRNLVDELVKHSGEIDIYIMTSNELNKSHQRWHVITPNQIPWKHYLFAFIAIVVATGLCWILEPYATTAQCLLIYILSITTIALLGKIGPSVFASILGAFSFTLLLPEERYLFAEPGRFFTPLLIFLVTQFINHLIILTQRQLHATRFFQNQTAALYAFSRKLTETNPENQLAAVTHYLANMFDSEILTLLPEKGQLSVYANTLTHYTLDEKEQSIAQWVFSMGKMAGRGTDTLTHFKSLYVPLNTSQGTAGVLCVQPHTDELFTPEQMHLLELCAHQFALALSTNHNARVASQPKHFSD